MKIDTYQCDQCKTQKKDANHWFRAYSVHGASGVLIVPWEVTAIAGKLELSADGETHLCGAECVTQWLSKNLLNAGAQ